VLRSSIASEINLSGHIVHLSTGEEIPVTLSILNTYYKKYSSMYLIETSLCDLIPGEYSLHLTAEEMTSKLRSHTRINFSVQ